MLLKRGNVLEKNMYLTATSDRYFNYFNTKVSKVSNSSK